MTQNPFGDLSDASLVDETAIDTGQTELIVTTERFEKMDPHVRRRFAAKLDSSDINGKSPHFVVSQAIAVQRTLTEYAEE